MSPAAPVSNRPALEVSGEEQVRRLLQDLVLAHERGDPDGVSLCDMARSIGVSRQHMKRYLSADHPQVNLRAGQLHRIDPRARKALQALVAGWGEAERSIRPPASRNRRVGALKGRIDGLLDQALADGEIDPVEAGQIRLAYAALGAECAAGMRDLDDRSSGR